jgi:hypothetical protein
MAQGAGLGEITWASKSVQLGLNATRTWSHVFSYHSYHFSFPLFSARLVMLPEFH